MKYNQKKLMPKIIKAVRNDLDASKYAGDIAFHLTDWLDDLQDFYNYLNNPDKYSNSEANKIIHIFLSHATNHIVAAYKLYIGEPVKDVFEVGAVEDKRRQKRV